MNKDQFTGILERTIYGVVVVLVARYGAKLGLSTDDGAWLAGGVVTFLGGTWAWMHNRPTSVLNRAGAAIPENTKLVITAEPHASVFEKIEAERLGSAVTSEKVSAKT